jgi:hypothetical protein
MIHALNATALEALVPTQPWSSGTVTAQLTQRFESQLQQPGMTGSFTQYAAPLAAPTGVAGDFRNLMDFAGRLSGEFRAKLEHPGTDFNSSRWPELRVLQEASREMRNLNLTTVQFQFVAAGVEITNRNAQMLFQQA